MKGVKLNDMDGNTYQDDLKDYVIGVLTKLLIEINFKEKEIGEEIYVKKKDCYKDLIKFVKEYM